MNTRLNTIGLLAVFILLTGLFAQPVAADSFQDANQLYKDNKYDQAIEAYEKIGDNSKVDQLLKWKQAVNEVIAKDIHIDTGRSSQGYRG